MNSSVRPSECVLRWVSEDPGAATPALTAGPRGPKVCLGEAAAVDEGTADEPGEAAEGPVDREEIEAVAEGGQQRQPVEARGFKALVECGTDELAHRHPSTAVLSKRRHGVPEIT